MKRLSDYKGDEAMILWADLLDICIEVFGDPEVIQLLRAKKPALLTAKELVQKYPTNIGKILLRIDPTPLNGLNIVTRLAGLIKEVTEDPDIQSFFVSQPEEILVENSSGSAMENTEALENPNISSNM